MRRLGFLLNFLAAIALLASDAKGYIDPGTGSMVLQAVIASILLVGSGLAFLRERIKRLFKRTPDKPKTDGIVDAE